jgi:DinB superfamily
MRRPAETEFASPYATYVSKVPETNVLSVLESQPAALSHLAARIPAERERDRYAPDKWSIREVFGHIVDTERVFGHRAFCIARGERQPLPGFDQNTYMAASHFDAQPLADLLREFAGVREANLIALRGLHDEDWDSAGVASGYPVSVRALAYMMAGHVRHHVDVLKERYAVSA